MRITEITNAVPGVGTSQIVVSNPKSDGVIVPRGTQISNQSIVASKSIFTAPLNLTPENEAVELETMIQKYQTLIKAERAKWFGKKDVSVYESKMARLVGKLVNILEKIFNCQMGLFNTGKLTTKQEKKELIKLTERLTKACEWGGGLYNQTAEKTKIAKNYITQSLKNDKERDTQKAMLEERIQKFSQWIKIPNKHETLRRIFQLWTTESASNEIKKMETQIVKLAIAAEEEWASMKFQNTNDLNTLVGALNNLISKKQWLFSLLKEGSLEKMEVGLEIRQHQDEIIKLKKQFEDNQLADSAARRSYKK